MEGTPTQPETLRRVMEARIRDIHVALPGRVDSYDTDKQVADITPMVRRVMPGTSEEAEDVMEDLPQLRHVPVVFMEGGDFYFTVPVTVGDTGLLIVNQWDPAMWRTSGEVSDPVDFRLHHPAHAVFLPGYKTAARALSGLPGSDMAFGKRGGIQIKVTGSTMEIDGNSNAVALATETKARLDALQSAHDSHKHAETGTTTGIPDTLVGPLGGIASTKLKLGG